MTSNPRSLPLPPSSFDCGRDNKDSGETLTAVPLRDKNVKELMEDITSDLTKGNSNIVRPSPAPSTGDSQRAVINTASSIAASYNCKECQYTSSRCNDLAAHIADAHQPGISIFSRY